MKHRFLLGAVFALLGFSGCSEPDNSSTNNPYMDTNEINFFLQNINSMKTRAGYDSPEDITRDDPGFGIYVVDDPEVLQTLGNRADNHQIKWGGSSWFNSTTQNNNIKLDWPDGATTVSAYAYCPYTTTIANVNAIPVDIKIDQSTLDNLKASDFIRAKSVNCQKNDGNIIPLTFYHQLSKLKFNIKWNELDEVGTPNEIILNDLRWKSSYNLNTDELTVSTNHTATPKGYIYNKTNKGATAEVIVMPQIMPVGKFVTIKTVRNGEDVFYVLKLENELEFKKNTQYNFNVFLNDSETTLSLSAAGIEDWGEVENGDWNIDANVKKENILKVTLNADMGGLTMKTTTSLPLHEKTDVTILLEDKYYFHNLISYLYPTGSCSLKNNGLGGGNYNLTLRALDSEYNQTPVGTTVDDGLMIYTIEPSEIYIPESIHITPVYNRETGTLILSASQNVKSDIVYRVFQRDITPEETVGIDAIIATGTNTSQAVDVSTWDKSTNAVISLKYKDSDTRYDYCRMIRENVYYHLEGSYWGSDPDGEGYENYYLHIIL